MSFNSSAYPYCTVVRITDTSAQGSIISQGSGVLISPDEVLTAAHVVWSSDSGAASNIVVTPAYNYGSAPFGSATGIYCHFMPVQDPGDMIALDQSQNDYAVIHLSKPFNNLGTMGLESNFTGGPVNVTGYPATANGGMVESTLYCTKDPNYSLLDGNLNGTGIGPGSSGGPVWVNGSGGPYVVGTVSSASIGGTTGYFTQITTSEFNQIRAWVAQDDAPPPPPPVQVAHANDLSYSSTASGMNHFIDLPNFEASFPDLIAAFGTNQSAMQNWYNTNEPKEHRVETFDGLDYVASYSDLMSAFGAAGSMRAVQDDGSSHFITAGYREGRQTTFNGLDYIASYGDLINALGANGDAGAYHYIEAGHNEGRKTTFDGLDYIASYPDLIKALGANEQAGAAHFINAGYREGRKTTFDGLAYIADYPDLMKAFGANNDAGATHYIDAGFSEHRSTSFNVGAYESAHPDLKGRYASDDAFLTAYINTYKTTGTFLT
jgi:predicted ribosomally synthesized peptide with SipW-like signal peptide